MSEKYKESTSKQLEKIDEEPINKNITINRTEFKFDDSLKEIDELISNPEKLKNGFNITYLPPQEAKAILETPTAINSN